MSFLDLGKTILNAGKEGLRDGLTGGILKGLGYDSANGKLGYNEYTYDANGNIKGVNSKAVSEISNIYGTNSRSSYNGISSGGLTQANYRTTEGASYGDPEQRTKYSGIGNSPGTMGRWGGGRVHEADSSYKYKVDANPNTDNYNLKLPTWGYADFINERAIWQKQLGSIFDEPAWFYFKIFFDFDTGHGLFGGLLNSDIFHTAPNGAAKYLHNTCGMYEEENPRDRITALYKFASILSYICNTAPWYFKGVNGLDKLSVPIMDDFSKERSIEIELNPDAIDMRLTTLMSLYKYACWDDYNHKEVIPENLRKFNMSIIIFQTPLRYLHTSFMTNKKMEFLGIDVNGLAGGLGGKLLNGVGNEKVNYKTIAGYNGEMRDRMSFKIYSLYDCEFDMESFAGIMPGSVSNEEPFQLGKNTLKITYSSCTEHSMNEFFEMMYGTNGFYFNQYSSYQNESVTSVASSIISDMTNSAHKKQLERYKALSETFGNLAKGGTILGLVNKPKTYQQAVDATEALMNGLFEHNDLLGDLGANYLLGLLGSSKSTDAPQGNLYGDVGIGSAYFKDKLEMLKHGVHENTMPPYTYDENGNPVFEKYKPANEYSAYDWQQTKQNISNFNLSDYLKKGSSNLGYQSNNALRKEFTKQPETYDPGENLSNEYNKYEITKDTTSLKESNKNIFKVKDSMNINEASKFVKRPTNDIDKK